MKSDEPRPNLLLSTALAVFIGIVMAAITVNLTGCEAFQTDRATGTVPAVDALGEAAGQFQLPANPVDPYAWLLAGAAFVSTWSKTAWRKYSAIKQAQRSADEGLEKEKPREES